MNVFHRTESKVSSALLLIFCSNYTFSPVCLCVFLALQPCVVVFSQPGSRLQPPRFRASLITHKEAPQSVGLLWTSDQSVADTSTRTTHNTHNRQTSMPPVGFEPTISAGERPQTHALDRTATGTGTFSTVPRNNFLYRYFFFSIANCASAQLI